MMGGKGSGRIPNFVKQFTPVRTNVVSVGGDALEIPNHSGIASHPEFVKAIDIDLTPYWKSNGTSTATGNWDIGANDFTTTGTVRVGSMRCDGQLDLNGHFNINSNNTDFILKDNSATALEIGVNSETQHMTFITTNSAEKTIFGYDVDLLANDLTTTGVITGGNLISEGSVTVKDDQDNDINDGIIMKMSTGDGPPTSYYPSWINFQNTFPYGTTENFIWVDSDNELQLGTSITNATTTGNISLGFTDGNITTTGDITGTTTNEKVIYSNNGTLAASQISQETLSPYRLSVGTSIFVSPFFVNREYLSFSDLTAAAITGSSITTGEIQCDGDLTIGDGTEVNEHIRFNVVANSPTIIASPAGLDFGSANLANSGTSTFPNLSAGYANVLDADANRSGAAGESFALSTCGEAPAFDKIKRLSINGVVGQATADFQDTHISTTGTIKGGNYESGDGSAGITQSETGVTDFDIVIKDGLITSFTKN